jgi:hypothetical protein
MRGNRAGAIRAFFDSLAEGDPVAVGFLLFFVILGIGLGLFALKVRRDLRRDDEKQARKYGRKPPT